MKTRQRQDEEMSLSDGNYMDLFGRRAHCHGVVVVKRETREVLLVRSLWGAWGFPKGKFETRDGTPLVNALRELNEETGLLPEHLSFIEDPENPGYYKWLEEVKPSTRSTQEKVTVRLLVAEYNGPDDHEFTFDFDEIDLVQWIPLDNIEETLGDKFLPRRYAVCREVQDLLFP